MIVCGGCTVEVPELARHVKRVTIAGPDGPLTLQKLGRRLRGMNLEKITPEDVFHTIQALHRKPGGTRVAYKALKGFVFTVHEDIHPVRQAPKFEGSVEFAVAAGWQKVELGWVCPDCVKTAHVPDEASRSTGGLEDFFEETKDL